MAKHANLTGASIHVPYAFTFADLDDRDAAVMTSGDVGKLAFVSDAPTIWILTNHDPADWVQVNTLGSASRIHGRDITSAAPADGDTLLWDEGTNQYIFGAGGGGGGGGGNTITEGALASLPAASNAGDVYYADDSLYMFVDNGSSWDAFYHSPKLTIPPSSGWSWVNQGSATLDSSKGYHVLYCPQGSGGYRLRVRNQPSTPYTITALIERLEGDPAAAQHGFGIGFRDSVSGKMHLALMFNAGGFYTASTLFAGTAPSDFHSHLALPRFDTASQIWIQITNDGTNRTVAVSRNGRTWRTISSSAFDTYFTPDQVFFFGHPGDDTYPETVTLLSWKES